MAKFRKKIENADFEIKLPSIFSKMKVTIEGRDVSVGKKNKKVHTSEFEQEGSKYLITLKQRPMPLGFDVEIQKDGSSILRQAITGSGKEIDPNLLDLPKWMYAIPILSGAPIFIGGAIPALVGVLGSATGYNVLSAFQDNRKKLILFGILNIVATYLILIVALIGFNRGMYEAGYMSHNKDILKSVVDKTNENLPIKIDDITTLQKATYEEDTLILHYNLFPLDTNQFNNKQFKSAMEPNLIQAACADPQMKTLMKNKFWIKYAYHSNKSPLGHIAVSKSKCGQ